MFRQLIESFKNDLKVNSKMVKLATGFLGVVLITAIFAISITLYESDIPDPAKAKLSDVEQYISSESFLKMPVSKRKDYINQVSLRIKSSDEEGMGMFLTRLYEKNRNTGGAVQISMLSSRLKPLNQLEEKEKIRKLNTMINLVEMAQGRHQMQQNFSEMFGGDSPEEKRKFLSETVRAMPSGMMSTTPQERKALILTLRLAKQMIEARSSMPVEKQPSSK